MKQRLFLHRRCLCKALPAIAAAAALATVSPLLAQTPDTDTGTLVFGQRQQQEETPSLWLSPVTGVLDLRATQTNTNTSTDSGTDTHTHERLFEETLTLSTRGYVVHPNLVDLRFSITGGLEQDHFSNQDESGSSNGTIYGWDISATFLRNQSAPLTVYTRRSESFFDVPFGPTERTTATQSGAILDYRTSESYMQFEAYRQEETQSAFGDGGTDYSQTRDVIRGTGQSQLSSNQTLSWNFSLENAQYGSQGDDVQQQSASGSITHAANFGEGSRNSLVSSLVASKTSGDLPSDDFRWNEHLHLWHTPEFETNYDYTFERLSFENVSTDRNAAYMDARHRLYKSLVTTGRLRWEDLQTDGSSTRTYNAELDLNYRKNVPSGELLIDAQVGYERQTISGSGTNVVVDQPFSFTSLDPLQVNQPNTIPASILIRDAVTGRIFTEGIDYSVASTPLGPQITRILGGNITTSEPLLLSYDYEPLGANQIDTTTFALGSRYQITQGPLAGLTPYARFFGQDQSISGGIAEPNNVRDYTAGAYYTVRELTLRAEREWYNSTLFPYDAWRYEARLTHAVSADTNFITSAMYTDTQYHAPEQQTRSYSLSATLSHRFSTHLYGSIYATYANVDSSTGGRTQGIEEGLQANYDLHETRMYMRIRNSTLNSDATDQQFQFFQIGLTRTF